MPVETEEELRARDVAPPGTVMESPAPGVRFYDPPPGQAPEMAAPPGTRMPLPSVQEQSQRWETPYDRQLANDFASEQAGLVQAQQQAQQTSGLNRNIAAQREAVKAATEFVRRKDAEMMVRSGVPIEEAEFKSRLKYNTGTAAQLNAARPVRPPAPMTIDGIPGVSTGRGDQWKPLPQQKGEKLSYLDQQTLRSAITAKARAQSDLADPVKGAVGGEQLNKIISESDAVIKRFTPESKGAPKAGGKEFDALDDAKKAGHKSGDVIKLWNPSKNKYGDFKLE